MNMLQEKSEKRAWRKVRTGQKFLNAFRGLWVFWKTTTNLYVHLAFGLLAVGAGLYFRIAETEWMFLIFSIGFVFVSEAFNTAIEIDIDLTSPEYHPYARDTKDVAAAAVLLSACTAILVGLVIFLPKLL